MALVRFSDAEPAALPPWLDAFEAWCRHQRQAGRLRRGASEAVYRAMWQSLAAWCVTQTPPIGLRSLDMAALKAYVASRHGSAGLDESLTPRYQWRLLRLVQRVQDHRAGRHGPRPAAATAAAALIAAQPAVRQANAADSADLPAHLPAGQARQLLNWLTGRTAASRSTPASVATGTPARTTAVPPVPPPAATGVAPGRWQAQRDRCAVALQLGAGLGPGDLRALRLQDVLRAGSGSGFLPSDLRIAASGSAPAHVTPLAPWAARLLADWLQRRQDEALGGDWLLPSTRSGKPWGKVAQYESARRVLAEAGLDEAAGGSFKLRHTFALRQLRRGRPAEDVARWLGVVDPAVMARYQRLLGQPATALTDGAPAQDGAARRTRPPV